MVAIRYLPPLFNFVFTVAIHAELLNFCEDPGVLNDLVHLDDDGVRSGR